MKDRDMRLTPFFKALLDPYQMQIQGVFKAFYRYIANYDWRLQTKIRHVFYSEGKWSSYLSHRLQCKTGITISSTAKCGPGLVVPHCMGVTIGNQVVLGSCCRIYQNVTLGQNRGRFPEVGNNVIIYAGAVVSGAVKVGDGAVVGANAVVTKDVPPNAIVGGVPAKIIKYREADEDRELR